MTDGTAPLFGEGYVFALLFRLVQDHCGTTNAGELKSFGIGANGDAMKALAQAGFIEILDQADNDIRAVVIPAADALVARFLAERTASQGK
jgi:hypothetical protein